MTGSVWCVGVSVAVFVISHVVLSSPFIRGPLVARLGERVFMVGYSVVSLLLFVWLVMAYNDSPYVEVWLPGTMMRHMALTIDPPQENEQNGIDDCQQKAAVESAPGPGGSEERVQPFQSPGDPVFVSLPDFRLPQPGEEGVSGFLFLDTRVQKPAYEGEDSQTEGEHGDPVGHRPPLRGLGRVRVHHALPPSPVNARRASA